MIQVLVGAESFQDKQKASCEDDDGPVTHSFQMDLDSQLGRGECADLKLYTHSKCFRVCNSYYTSGFISLPCYLPQSLHENCNMTSHSWGIFFMKA